MKNNNEKEELQSRREFFKEAAKKALPVIGAIALVSSPILANATEMQSMGCENSCSGGCTGGCSGSCSSRCTGCSGTCTGSCKGSCAVGCTSSSH